MSYRFMLDIALILLSTKVFGLISRRFNMPQVVGALIAGLVFGPTCLNILQETDYIAKMSELGVVVIMFSAGLTTELRELKNAGKSGFLVALVGVLVPLAAGVSLGYIFNRSQVGGTQVLFQNIFVGVILTATSVSITVETLKEIGKLNTKVGNTILAAAIIDDILGLICLTVISGLGGGDVNIALVLLKIFLFLVCVVAFGLLAWKLFGLYIKHLGNRHLQRFPILAFILCLVFAYSAEHFFGVADIIGAFAAGLVVGNTSESEYIESKFSPLSFLLLTPIFFASIGIKVTVPAINLTLLWVTLAMLFAAVSSKLIGCGIGARFCGMTTKQSIQVGFGMVCRGEVALIVADKGTSLGLMPEIFLGPIIIVVILTAIVTPLLLKLAFHGEDKYEGITESALAERQLAGEQLDAVSRSVLDADNAIRTDRHS